jgi:hypothetical protein
VRYESVEKGREVVFGDGVGHDVKCKGTILATMLVVPTKRLTMYSMFLH